MRSRLFDFRLGDVRNRLVAGRRALFVYPLLAIVAFMCLNDDRIHWTAKGVHVATLLYPFVYFVCLDVTIALRNRKHDAAALSVSNIPLWHFAIVSALALISVLIDAT